MESSATNQSIDSQIEYERKLLELAQLKAQRKNIERGGFSEEKHKKFWRSHDRLWEENKKNEGLLKAEEMRRSNAKSLVNEYYDRNVKILSELTDSIAKEAEKGNLPWDELKPLLVKLKDSFDNMQNSTNRELRKGHNPQCKWWVESGCKKLHDANHMLEFHHPHLCVHGTKCTYGQNDKNKECRFVHREPNSPNFPK